MGITYASPPNRAKNISTLLSGMGVEGMGPSLAAIGTLEAEVFEAYLERVLLRKLPPELLITSDDLSAHKSERVEDAIEVRIGGVVVPLPPYSQAPNRSKKPSSRSRAYCEKRKPAQRCRSGSDGAGALVDNGCMDARGFFARCGYRDAVRPL